MGLKDLIEEANTPVVPGPPITPKPVTDLPRPVDIDEAQIRNEMSTSPESVPEADALAQPGMVSFRKLPTSPQEAIRQALDEGIRIPNTPAYAKKVDSFARAWQYLTLRREGLLDEHGLFAEDADDELLQDIKKSFYTVGVRLLADLTEEEVDASVGVAADKYIDMIIQRGQHRRNEVLANMRQDKTAPPGANNLSAAGRAELHKVDMALSSAVQLKNQTDRPAVGGAFRSVLHMAHTKLMSSRRTPEETKERLQVKNTSINLSTPQLQEALQLTLTDNPDDLRSGPVRQFARTFEFIREVTDPDRAYQLMANSFEGAVRQARAKRLSLNPNLNPTGLAYSMHPELLGRIGEVKLINQVRKDITGSARSMGRNVRKGELELALEVARETTLPGIIGRSVSRTETPVDDLLSLEAMSTRGFVPDLEAKTLQALGTVVGAFSEQFGPPARALVNVFPNTRGTPEEQQRARNLLRRQRDQLKLATNDFNTIPQLIDDQAIEEQAAWITDPSISPEEKQARVLMSRQRSAVRGLYRRDIGLQQKEAIDTVRGAIDPRTLQFIEVDPEATLEEAKQALDRPHLIDLQTLKPPGEQTPPPGSESPQRLLHPDKPQDRIEPLKSDFTNLESFLEDAAREGTIPWRDGRILFTEANGSDVIENAVARDFHVLAPQAVLKMVRAGMGVEEIRKMQEEASLLAFEEKVIGSMPTSDIQKIADELTQQLAKMHPLERGRPDLVTKFAWARLNLGIREIAREYIRDPQATTDMFVGTAVLSTVAQPVAGLAISTVRSRLMNTALSSRLRRAIADTAAADGQAAVNMRGFLGKSMELGELSNRPRKTLDAMRATADVADTLNVEHQKGTLGSRINGNVPDAKVVSQGARKLKRTLKQLNVEDLDSIANSMDIPLHARQMMQDIRQPIIQVIQAVQENFAEWANIDGLSLRPWVRERIPQIAAYIDNAIRTGSKVDPDIMPIGLEVFSQKPTRMKQILNTSLAELLKPEHRKVLSDVGDYMGKMTEYLAKYVDETTGVHFLQAEQRANQVAWLDFLKRKHLNEIADLNVAVPNEVYKQQLRMAKTNPEFAPSPEMEMIQARKRELGIKRQRLEGDRQAVDMKGWDEPIRMSGMDYNNDATDADVITWARNMAAENPYELYRATALAGETFGDFENRLLDAVAGNLDPKEVKGLRTAILRRYLDAPGLSSKQILDTQTGLPKTNQEAGRLAARRGSVRKARAEYEGRVSDVETLVERREVVAGERRALSAQIARLKRKTETPDIKAQIAMLTTERAQVKNTLKGVGKDLSTARRKLKDARKLARHDDPEFIPEVLGANLGLSQKDLKGPYKKLVETAGTESAASLVNRIEILSNIDSGLPPARIQLAKDTALQMRFMMEAQLQRTEFFAKRYANLTPGERIQFDRLVAAAGATGDSRKLVAAGKRNKKFRALMEALETDPDQKVLNLFQDSEDFRKNLLHEGWVRGVLDEPEFMDLVGAYSPHLFKNNEWRTFMGNTFDPEVFEKATDLGFDFSELLRQKDLDRFKAAVYVKGGRKITQLFDSFEDAQDWVRNSYGVKKTKKLSKFGEGQGVMEGSTELNDPFAILEPLGQDRARALGMLPEGVSLFTRLDTLVRDLYKHMVLKTFDRPGWALTTHEFNARKAGPDGEMFAAQFTAKPLEDIRTNGPLRGKHVRKRVVSTLEDVEFFEKQHKLIEKAWKEKAADSSLIPSLAYSAGAFLAGSTRKMKQALITSRIARSVKTVFYNWAMDGEIFGTLAGGRDYSLTHPGSHISREQAIRDVFAIFRDKDVQPSEQYFLGIEDGVQDDFLTLGAIQPNTKKHLNRVLFGEDPTQGKLGGTLGDRIERILGGRDDNPQFQALMDRHRQIQGDLDRQTFAPESDQFARLVEEQKGIELKLKDENGTTMLSRVQRAFEEFNDAVVADKKLGTFKDIDDITREFYGRISQVNRFGAYYHLLRKGFDRKVAAERVGTFMQTYRALPSMVRSFASSPLGSPVIAFPMEQTRIMFNALRYNPAAFLGLVSGIGGMNFMTLAASGIDPFQVLKTMEGDSMGLPALLTFLTTPVIPHADGTFSTFGIPSLNMLQLVRAPFGMQSVTFDADDSGKLELPEMLKNVGSKFVAGQPTLNLAYAGVSGRDPKTGMKLHDRSSFWGKAAEEIFSFLVPPELPVIGDDVRRIHEGMRRPAYMRSQREVSLAQRWLQGFFQLRARGKIGSGETIGKIAEVFSTLWGAGISFKPSEVPIPMENLPQEGFGEKDFIAAVMVGTRGLDPKNGEQERFLDEAFTTLRRAVQEMKSSDPERRKVGQKLRDRAFELFEEKLDGHSDFYDKSLRNMTEQEKNQATSRVLNSWDLDAAFDRMSAVRKTETVLQAIALGRGLVKDELIQSFLRRIKISGTQVRLLSSERAIQDALLRLDLYLKQPPTSRFLSEVKTLRAYMQGQAAMARAKQQLKEGMDPISREAAQLIRQGQ